MPSSTPKQAAFMRAVSHNSEFANKVDVPQSVGKDFVRADKRKALIKSLRRPVSPGGVRG